MQSMHGIWTTTKREKNCPKGTGWIAAVLPLTSQAHYAHPASPDTRRPPAAFVGKHWLAVKKLWRLPVLPSPRVPHKTEGMNQYWSVERNIWKSAIWRLKSTKRVLDTFISYWSISHTWEIARSGSHSFYLFYYSRTTGNSGKMWFWYVGHRWKEVGSSFCETSNCATWDLPLPKINETHWHRLCNVPAEQNILYFGSGSCFNNNYPSDDTYEIVTKYLSKLLFYYCSTIIVTVYHSHLSLNVIHHIMNWQLMKHHEQGEELSLQLNLSD